MGINSKKPPGGGANVDLGFTDLLKGSATEVPPVDKHPIEEKDNPAQISSSPPCSEYASFAAQGLWKELSAVCDARLPAQSSYDTSFENLEARIWWIAAQYELHAVPLSILSAPLDTASKIFKERYKEFSVAIEAGRLAELKEALLSLLNKVVEALRVQGDTGLEEELNKRRAEWGIASEKVSPAKNEIPLQAIADHKTHYRRSLDELELKRADVRMQNTNNQEITGRNSGFLLLLIALLVLIGVGLWKFFPRGSDSPIVASTSEKRTDSIQRAELVIEPPSLIPSRPELLTRVSQLDAIFYDMDNERKQRLQAQQRNSSPVSSADLKEETGVQDSAVAASQPLAEGERRTRREVINTSGPLEPADFPRTREAPPPRETYAPVSRDRAHPPVPRAPSGGYTEPPRFETFPRPRYYRTLTRTAVMPSPSLKSASLDEIPSGTEVLAEAKEGYWLKIRSKEGKIGYVFAQDLERLPEW